MNRDPYVDLCLSVQAIRRGFEGVRTPLAPAIGVAASMYTHQVANVLRVLTDVRVRHLLADEVGLGKTVQALMILNALRTQRPELRAFIMVPDRLVAQWRDELMTRAHTAPSGDARDLGAAQYVRLAWEDQLKPKDAKANPPLALGDIDPERFDVLVVDELHRLRADVQDRIVRVAPSFEHVLVLTATPTFQHPARHAQLLALLEPERTALARWAIARGEHGAAEGLAVTDDISKWPEWATRSVVDLLLARDRDAAGAAGDADDLSATAMAHCAYRRVIRTRRTDYSGVLPRREHHPVVVEPLGVEVDRQSLMWRYFEHLSLLSSKFDPVLLAKRVILSPPSLEQRVDFFRRKGHERGGLLELVKPLVHRSQGDSRADALVDLLSGVWARNPCERVLVAAQDNLTVDYLFDLVLARLPEVGPLQSRTKLVAARIRQGMATEALEDIGGFGNETNENLEEFQRGEALVLFAPEAAQVGLNLQCARVLVLYSVPWKPEEVEQWIGRLDRIGNVAAFSNEGAAKTIDVYTIAQRGLVDEKVVTVLQRFHAFERSVNLDGAHLEEVAQRIEAAALRPGSASWRDLEGTTEVMAAEDEVQELDSALRAYLPWGVRWATSERARLDALAPAPPILTRGLEPSTGPRAWDRAFEGMLHLLERAGDYHIYRYTDPATRGRFQTLWYRFGVTEMYGRQQVTSKVVFTCGADPGEDRSPRHAHAYITRRGDIGTPPRREVTMTLDGVPVRRPLRFLSFGDALHDELIQGWTPDPAERAAVDVSFFDDHEIWKHSDPSLYVLRWSVLDPADVLDVENLRAEALGEAARAASRSPEQRLLGLIRPFVSLAQCALSADVRWLRAQLNATMRIDAQRRTGAQWTRPSEPEVAALLNPMAHPRKGLPRAVALGDAAALAAAASQLANIRAATPSGKGEWSHRLPDFARALATRALVVREEGRDAVMLAREELDRATAAVRDAADRGSRAQIKRAENSRDEAADLVDMTEAFWRRRLEWLLRCEHGVRSLRPTERLIAVVRTRRAR